MCKVETAIVEAEDFGVTADGEFLDISYYGIGRWGSNLRSELNNHLPHFGISTAPAEGELIAIDVEVGLPSWEYEAEFRNEREFHQDFHVRTKHFNDGTFYYTVEYETGSKGSFFHKKFCKNAYSASEVAAIIATAVKELWSWYNQLHRINKLM